MDFWVIILVLVNYRLQYVIYYRLRLSKLIYQLLLLRNSLKMHLLLILQPLHLLILNFKLRDDHMNATVLLRC